MKYSILSLSFISFLNTCLQAQSCEDLPGKFDSYSAATKAVRAADFQYTDEIPAGSSSSIITAEYFSCDGNFGYFICSTDKGNGFIYEAIPKNLWIQFKNADSKGVFYETHLKNNYNLIHTTRNEWNRPALPTRFYRCAFLKL